MNLARIQLPDGITEIERRGAAELELEIRRDLTRRAQTAFRGPTIDQCNQIVEQIDRMLTGHPLHGRIRIVVRQDLEAFRDKVGSLRMGIVIVLAWTNYERAAREATARAAREVELRREEVGQRSSQRAATTTSNVVVAEEDPFLGRTPGDRVVHGFSPAPLREG